MLNKMLVTGILAILFAVTGFAQKSSAKVDEKDVSVLSLSPKLRSALIAEMTGIKKGMAELSTLLATAEWNMAARRAAGIRDSYILKQKLTHADLEKLMHALPPNFIAMDSAFHRHAGGLVHAAEERNYELAVFYFSKMMEGCGSCHSSFATHTFKGFKQINPGKAHGH